MPVTLAKQKILAADWTLKFDFYKLFKNSATRWAFSGWFFGELFIQIQKIGVFKSWQILTGLGLLTAFQLGDF